MMEHVRSSARILAHEGVIEITQKGAVVDPENFKGAIRLRWKKKAKS
jgi:predicted transcriptional regulator